MRRLVILACAAAVVLVGALTAVAIARDKPDTASHVARECRFLAAVETQRMVRWETNETGIDAFWRAEGRTGGPPRPDLAASPGADLPKSLGSRLIQWLTPKRALPSIDCGAVFDVMRIPTLIRYEEGPIGRERRLQYSRVSFLPGDRYALVRRIECYRVGGRWDQTVWFDLWRRRGGGWEPVNVHRVNAVFIRPRFETPMRCFDPAYEPRPGPGG
ncbi:hypothetical protein [Caulobacter mirabilis]|uniref:DUF4440 domain-containing protein n=1 Tax=Caulobacter mirabilis TaxID=69666 RepID=A0A2D2AZX6_9CAUL|nr:hypothetical protein [Caulobacter mirabilis]ATQ43552.1 hypothetical protein CSW64_14645 [Caulobacter mirabilis]